MFLSRISSARQDDRGGALMGVIALVGVTGIIAATVGTVSVGSLQTTNGVAASVEARGAADSGNVATMGWFIMIMTPIAVALVVWRTPEWIAPEKAGHRFALKDYWSLVARGSMVRILLADLCLALGPGWMSALYLFFFTDSRGFTTGQSSILLAVYILAGFAGAPAMGRLAMSISKHRAVMVATTGYSLVLISLMAIPKGNMLIAVAPMRISSVLPKVTSARAPAFHCAAPKPSAAS